MFLLSAKVGDVLVLKHLKTFNNSTFYDSSIHIMSYVDPKTQKGWSVYHSQLRSLLPNLPVTDSTDYIFKST